MRTELHPSYRGTNQRRIEDKADLPEDAARVSHSRHVTATRAARIRRAHVLPRFPPEGEGFMQRAALAAAAVTDAHGDACAPMRFARRKESSTAWPSASRREIWHSAIRDVVTIVSCVRCERERKRAHQFYYFNASLVPSEKLRARNLGFY